MNAAIASMPDSSPTSESPLTITLLDLVGALIDTGASDRQVTASVMHLVASGRVRLVGQVCGEDLLAD